MMEGALQLGIVEGLLAIAFLGICAIAHLILRRNSQREADRALEQILFPDRPPQLTYRGISYELSETKPEAIAKIPVQYRGTPDVVTVFSTDQIPEGVTQLKFRGVPYIQIR